MMKCVFYRVEHAVIIERKSEIEGMWDEVLRFENPHNYYVDLSQKLWDIKNEMIKERR